MDDFTKPEDEQLREEFRKELHQALESTHRQHMAQNTLGIQRSNNREGSWYIFFGRYTFLILTGAVIYYAWSQKTKQMKRKKDN